MKKIILLISIIACAFLSTAQAPTADFSASSTEVCLGDPINFNDQSTPGISPLTTWSWDFGDGNSATGVNVSHTYAAEGTYTVTLVVTAQNGQADPEVKVDYIVVNSLPNVAFTTSGNGCTVPFDVTFNNTSDPGLNYNWDFGNGQNSTAASPGNVTYNTSGNFTATLTATDPVTGCSSVSTQAITISDYLADFTAPSSGCVGSSIQFTDASTTGTNSWSWNFGDGSSGSGANPSHTYTTPGTYTVILTAQNSGSGCMDDVSYDITIHDTPTPSFTADIVAGCAPLDVNFTNTSGAGSAFDWDFGNGTTFTGANPPSQTYTGNGSFTVALTMTDANGCTATFTEVDLITLSSPDVQFAVDVSNGCSPLTVQFSESSTSPNPTQDPIVSWEWDFGDGSVFNGQVPPPHTYNVGVYDVTLTVTTQNGCEGTLTIPEMVEVGSILSVDFTVSPIVECAKTDVFFVDATTFGGTPDPGEVIYNWDFGDGGTSSQQSPSYQYPSDTGYFDVTLIVNWRGCIDTLEMDSAVYIKAPISLFGPDQTLFCNPASLPVTLNVADNAIHGEQNDDVEMIWKWGDGSQYTLSNSLLDDANKGDTSHTYADYGTYIIEQVIYNYTTGCEDSTTQTIHVSQTNAAFSPFNDSICVGSPLELTSTSTSTHGLGMYTYSMGDGGSTGGDPATYTYNASGTYDIELIVINNVGCADTTEFTNFTALSLPDADLSPSATSGCAPITVSYTNNAATTGNGVPLESFLWTYPNQTTETTNNVATQTSYPFTSEGTFTTTLVATDVFGCVSSPANVSMTITKPTADFSIDSVVCNQESFNAVNSSVSGVNYEWFVDGDSVSTDTDYSSSFNETQGQNSFANHQVTLIAEDANGCLDTLEQTIVVSLPLASFSYDFSGASVNAAGEFTCPPVFADYTDESNSYGAITQWDWSFGDGKFSSLQDPSNTYVFAGTYTASLSVVDEFGCTDDTILVDYLSISGPSGDPNWTSSMDICGQSYIFDLQNENNVTAILWDLGDGNTSEELTQFTHTYASVDEFSPVVTLIDSLGCEVPYELPPIQVPENGLEAFFEPSTLQGDLGAIINFSEQSTTSGSPITEWVWTANGDTTILGSPDDLSQPFGLPGQYEVTLTVTNANGCTDSYATVISIANNFELPNVISVNGDNINDVAVLGLPIFNEYTFTVVNRWGNFINTHAGGASSTFLWDGTNQNGTFVSDGVYFYTLSGILVDGTPIERHGHITVYAD